MVSASGWLRSVMIAGFDGGPPDRVIWASEIAGSAVVEVASVTGGITATKWVLHLLDGRPLVVRWSDPRVGVRLAVST